LGGLGGPRQRGQVAVDLGRKIFNPPLQGAFFPMKCLQPADPFALAGAQAIRLLTDSAVLQGALLFRVFQRFFADLQGLLTFQKPDSESVLPLLEGEQRGSRLLLLLFVF